MLNGKRVKEAREKKKYSQAELGNMIGVTKASVCSYEKETRIPKLNVFESLIDALDLDVQYALGREVSVVSEKNINYGVKLSSEDVKIIKNLKTNKKLYRLLCDDPKRTLELIERKLNK
ncbi:MAG: helix-turn-helix transcriptional regulator [Mycoplasmatota bacterium]